jgi:hypothetical protein
MQSKISQFVIGSLLDALGHASDLGLIAAMISNECDSTTQLNHDLQMSFFLIHKGTSGKFLGTFSSLLRLIEWNRDLLGCSESLLYKILCRYVEKTTFSQRFCHFREGLIHHVSHSTVLQDFLNEASEL